MEEIEILPLMGTVVYPQTVTPLAIAQPGAVRLVDSDGGRARRIGVVALRSPQRRPDTPTLDDCYPIGTLALVHRLLRLPDGTLRVAIEGLERFELLETVAVTPILRARVRSLVDPPAPQLPVEQIARLKELVQHLAEQAPGLNRELIGEIAVEDEPRRLSYLVAAAFLAGRPLAERQEILDLATLEDRFERLISMLGKVSSERNRLPTGHGRTFHDTPAGRALWLRHTSIGSEVAHIDAVRMAGSGTLIVTGQRGRLARDTAQIALSWLRSSASRLGIDGDFFSRSDVHVHIPPGALPDEQPAAGAAVALALAGLLTRRPAAQGVAICGDICLHGQILPVRRLPEKLAAAQRAGLHMLALSATHSQELAALGGELAAGVRLLVVDYLADALEELLVS